MQSFIVISKNQEKIRNKIEDLFKKENISRFDITILEKTQKESGLKNRKRDQREALGIEDIREIQRKIFLTPLQRKSKMVILQTHNLITLEAQNSLLKLLEEPPDNTFIVLTASSLDVFIPTVISRCQVIKIDSGKPENINEQKYKILFEDMEQKGIGERLKIAQNLSLSKEISTEALTVMARNYREKLTKENINLKILKLIQQAYIDILTTNANSRLVLENLFISV